MNVRQAHELRAVLPLQAMTILADASYALPTRAWLRLVFWPWFKEQREGLGLANWTRTNDCDNFARAYAQAAADCHALTRNPSDAPEGLAVGEWYYIQEKTHGAHAIVAAYTETGLCHIEPQTGEFIILTPAEVQSCFFVRF